MSNINTDFSGVNDDFWKTARETMKKYQDDEAMRKAEAADTKRSDINKAKATIDLNVDEVLSHFKDKVTEYVIDTTTPNTKKKMELAKKAKLEKDRLITMLQTHEKQIEYTQNLINETNIWLKYAEEYVNHWQNDRAVANEQFKSKPSPRDYDAMKRNIREKKRLISVVYNTEIETHKKIIIDIYHKLKKS